MTYIEFFDKTSLENICACLAEIPERVIYIGDNAKLMKRHIDNYAKIFVGRGHNIEFLCRTVPKGNVDQIVSVLTDIVNEYEDCVFGLTGGEETAMFALGIVFERCREKNIQVHKFSIRNNRILDCDKDGNTIYMETPRLTVEENIRIYGGDIAYGSIDEDKTYLWDMNAEFIKDIDRMWSICKGDPRAWNTQIAVLEDICKVGTVSEDGKTVVADKLELEAYMEKDKHSYKVIRGIINRLHSNGLLEYEDSGDRVIVSYKNKQIKKCLTKAGLALEMKIYSMAKDIKDAEGTPLYHDVINGVVIDWDGIFHESEENLYQTTNEIDVLLMHDMIPIFISCKNGTFDMEELYKLNTVAERFGGKYSKKVLVATSLKALRQTGEYIRQRAKDMHISIIEDVQDMDDRTLEKKIKNVWCC